MRPRAAGLTHSGRAGTAEDLLSRGKAFRRFGRGCRLPDPRRLVRQDGRTGASVLPTGPHPREPGNRGADVAFPVPQAERNDRSFVAQDRTDGNA